MPESSPRPRVKSGIPWFVWLLMILVGGGVVIGLFASLMPVDPEKSFKDALAAYESKNSELFSSASKTVQSVAGYEKHTELLQGLDLLGKARPLKAVPLFESAAENPDLRTMALSYQALAMSRGEQRTAAIDVLQEAISSDPENPVPHGILGGILYELGAFQKAIPELLFTVEHSSNSEAAAAHSLRAGMLSDLDRFEEAAVEYEEALTRNPANPSNGMLGLKLLQCLNKSGQFEKTLKMIETADSSPQRDAIRAKALLEVEGSEEALKFIKTAFQGEQQDSSLYTAYAEAMKSQPKEDIEKALPKLRQAMLRLSRDPDYFAAMAEVLKIAEANEEAALYEKNALQLQDSLSQYRQVRASVITNHTNATDRVRAGQLAGECGLYEQAQLWLTTAKRIDPSLQKTVTDELQKLMTLQPELVSLGEYRVMPEPPRMGGPGGGEAPNSGIDGMTPPAGSASGETNAPRN